MSDLLLVEDDADLADVMARLLRTRGHVIRTATNGKVAIEEILRKRPDVVLLDLAMPVMDGAGLLEVLRSYFRFYDLPVIVVTAFPPTDPSVVQAQVAGIQGLFHKGSYNIDQLLDHIQTLVGP
jgi:CheY-like chemotaxis protein